MSIERDRQRDEFCRSEIKRRGTQCTCGCYNHLENCEIEKAWTNAAAIFDDENTETEN